jgi:hypothetical protein
VDAKEILETQPETTADDTTEDWPAWTANQSRTRI